MKVTTFSKEQANDFIKKWMQNRIVVDKITKDDEDNIYFVTLLSGSIFNKVKTFWQFRPSCLLTDMLFNSKRVGLCFGEVYDGDQRFDFYTFDNSLLEKANKIVAKEIIKWEKKSPI